MRNEKKLWTEVRSFGIVPVGLLLITLTLLIAAIWPLGESAAAWVQAIGSIGAIGVAIWIPNRQLAIQEKRASNKNQALICALDLVTSELIDPINFFTSSFKEFVNGNYSVSSTNFRHYDEEFERIRSALDEFKIIDMPHPKLTVAVAVLKEESRVLHEKCRGLMECFESGYRSDSDIAIIVQVENESDLKRLLRAANNIRRHARDINILCEEILDDRYDGRFG